MWSHLQKKSLRENVNFCAVNISLKAFKKWPNFQQNSKLLQILLPGRAIEIHLLFKSEGPMDIRHRISMALDPRKSNLGISNGCGFIFGSLWYFLAKCDSYFITKYNKSLLQNASAFLLQNAQVLL